MVLFGEDPRWLRLKELEIEMESLKRQVKGLHAYCGKLQRELDSYEQPEAEETEEEVEDVPEYERKAAALRR